MDSAVLLDLLGNENRRRILRLLSHKPCYVTEISEYLGVSPKAVIDHLRRLEEAGLVESRTDDQRRKYFHIARNLRLEVSVSPYRFGAKSAYPASRSLDMRGRCQHISLELPGDGTGRDPERDLDGDAEAPPADGGAGSETEPSAAGTGTAVDDADRIEDTTPDEITDGTADTAPSDGNDADEADASGPDLDPAGDGRRTSEAGRGVFDAGRSPSGDDRRTGDDVGETGREGTADGAGDDVAELARQYAYLDDVESELSLAQRWVHGRVTDVLDSLSERIGSEADSRFYAEILAAIARGERSARDIARELNVDPERVETGLERLSDRGLVEHDGTGWTIR